MSEAGQQHHGGHGGHAVHSPGGGDGGFGNFLDMGGGDGHHHNFLSHLLGLDHDAHSHHGGHAGAEGLAPSQSTGWNSALQSLKLSDALQGINVTPNFLFILLFLGFFSWLFVIYWVRHHEPLANSVLGVAAARSATAAEDRRLIAGTKYAFPTRTCPSMGDIYVPGVPEVTSLPQHGAVVAAESVKLPTPPVPPIPAPNPEPMPLASSYGVLPGPGAYSPQFGQPAPHAFYVPQAIGGSSRVKMIVNR